MEPYNNTLTGIYKSNHTKPNQMNTNAGEEQMNLESPVGVVPNSNNEQVVPQVVPQVVVPQVSNPTVQLTRGTKRKPQNNVRTANPTTTPTNRIILRSRRTRKQPFANANPYGNPIANPNSNPNARRILKKRKMSFNAADIYALKDGLSISHPIESSTYTRQIWNLPETESELILDIPNTTKDIDNDKLLSDLIIKKNINNVIPHIYEYMY
jgi:hypothetical protein